MLQAMNVSLIYRTEDTTTPAVRNVSLTVQKGELVGILGPSGSGKSSLLYLLSGLKQSNEGTVVFEGRDYSELTSHQLNELRLRQFGFVFQLHFLVEYLTVIENVLVNLPRFSSEALERAEQLLQEFEVAEYAYRFPHQLSVGQRQRVAIARALIHNPRVVFADEPTASLDRAIGQRVVSKLADYCHRNRDNAVVVVTHDPAILAAADHVMEIRDGCLTHSTSSPLIS